MSIPFEFLNDSLNISYKIIFKKVLKVNQEH